MALPNISDVRALNDEEIAEEILAVKRQLFELRLQKATRRLEKTHEFTHAKHRLAQLLTVESERLHSQGKAKAANKQTSEATEAIASTPDSATDSEPASVDS